MSRIDHSMDKPKTPFSNVFARFRDKVRCADIEKNILDVSMERLNRSIELSDLMAYKANGIKPEDTDKVNRRIAFLNGAITSHTIHIITMEKALEQLGRIKVAA